MCYTLCKLEKLKHTSVEEPSTACAKKWLALSVGDLEFLFGEDSPTFLDALSEFLHDAQTFVDGRNADMFARFWDLVKRCAAGEFNGVTFESCKPLLDAIKEPPVSNKTLATFSGSFVRAVSTHNLFLAGPSQVLAQSLEQMKKDSGIALNL
jgi:hypothetical protein